MLWPVMMRRIEPVAVIAGKRLTTAAEVLTVARGAQW
jgi:hypothetical protein